MLLHITFAVRGMLLVLSVETATAFTLKRNSWSKMYCISNWNTSRYSVNCCCCFFSNSTFSSDNDAYPIGFGVFSFLPFFEMFEIEFHLDWHESFHSQIDYFLALHFAFRILKSIDEKRINLIKIKFLHKSGKNKWRTWTKCMWLCV